MIDPFDPSRFVKSNTCLPCCAAPTPGCYCALTIPIEAAFPTGFTITPCADYATAAALVASMQVADCLGYCQYDGASPFTAFSANVSTPNELILSATGNPDGSPTCQARMWASLSLLSGSTLTVNSSAGGGLLEGGAVLYACDGTQIDFQTGATINFSIPADGEYFIICIVTSNTPGFMGGSDTMTADITCNNTMWTNPVIALWDDSGTTRKLWACPKLLLPPLVEATGTWYADCTEAVYQLDHQTSNCVAWEVSDADPPQQVSDGGTTLDYSVPGTSAGLIAPWWSSVNAEGGETLTLSWSVSGGTPPNGTVDIYGDDGILIETLTGSSPLTSSALPYTGRYILTVTLSVSFPNTCDDLSGSISSSGTMSVNPVQAAYDVGLTCPALLNCGDSCP